MVFDKPCRPELHKSSFSMFREDETPSTRMEEPMCSHDCGCSANLIVLRLNDLKRLADAIDSGVKRVHRANGCESIEFNDGTRAATDRSA